MYEFHDDDDDDDDDDVIIYMHNTPTNALF
jgi:hypothetical protein